MRSLGDSVSENKVLAGHGGAGEGSDSITRGLKIWEVVALLSGKAP